MPRLHWSSDDLGYQAIVAESALKCLTENVQNVSVNDLITVTEAFHHFTEAIAKHSRHST